jgi:S-adenosylmethionine synthetase
VGDASCTLVSRIGRPLDEPELADLQLELDRNGVSAALHAQAVKVVRENLATMDVVRDGLLHGRETVF